ncbi:MAG: TonB-dependent receptor [Gammaproteobacteria bacterium]|nr:TonB-dependent receptor [Gammaproteobacteria bacterium]
MKFSLSKWRRAQVLAAAFGFSLAVSSSAEEIADAPAEEAAVDGKVIEEIPVYGQQISTRSSTGSRLNLSVMETPATVAIINGDSIRERLDFTVLEAVTRTAGFTNEAIPDNGGQSIAARGFRGQGAVTKLFDGTSYFNAFGTITFPFDTWGVERIEVLKGPSSVLYGEGGIGGALNVIPKKPQQEPGRDLRVTFGENDTAFVGIGLTGGVTDNLAYRLDYSHNRSDNWVRNGDSETDMLSVALNWQATDDFSLSLRYDYGDQDAMSYYGIPVVDGDFARELLKANFEFGDGVSRYEDQALRVRADWQLSDSLAMQAEYYHLETDRLWRNAYFSELDRATGLVRRSFPWTGAHAMDHDGGRVIFALDNTLAGVGLRTSVGFEVNDIAFARPTNFGPGNPKGVNGWTDFDLVDPHNFVPGRFADVTAFELAPDGFSELTHYALFAESQIRFTEALALVLALRYEDADTDYRQIGRTPFEQAADTVTGRVGAVYDIAEHTAFYAQYSTGATHPNDSLIRAVPGNRDADFIRSEQIEVGVKQQLFEGRLQWSLALFDITKKDLIEDDPDSANPDDVLTFPEQTSQGIELSFNLQVSDALQVYGNGSILDAQTDSGATPNYVPEETANLGLIWAPLARLQLIADTRYVGERFHPSIPIPSYTVVDASARISISDRLSLTVKADNVFDELYASAASFSTAWLVGKPRTLSLTADYRF